MHAGRLLLMFTNIDLACSSLSANIWRCQVCLLMRLVNDHKHRKGNCKSRDQSVMIILSGPLNRMQDSPWAVLSLSRSPPQFWGNAGQTKPMPDQARPTPSNNRSSTSPMMMYTCLVLDCNDWSKKRAKPERRSLQRPRKAESSRHHQKLVHTATGLCEL